MKIGVVGNRDGWEYTDIKKYLDGLNLSSDDVLISGGALGVDKYVEEYAMEKNIKIMVFYPTLSEPSPLRYFNRNRNIALTCDRLIAFDKKVGASGTKNTIKYVKELGKSVTIVKM